MGNFIGRSKNITETIEILEACHKSTRVPILWGPPGIGKTALVRALAEKHNLPLHILIPSTMDPTDIEGLPALKQTTLPDGSEATTTENTLTHWAEALIRQGEGILFFDEASTAVPAVQAALLSVLQGRKVGRHTLPDNIWMIAAANDADVAADGWELSAPMANRFVHINFEPDNDDFFEGMSVAWNNKVTDREFDERAKVVSFLKAYPTLINKMPSTAKEAGKAWPSYRSWDGLASTLSFVDSVAGRRKVILGSVGESAAKQFIDWERTLKLPAYENVLADPAKLDWVKLSSSEVYVILSMVLGRMNAGNVEKSAQVFKVAAEVGDKTDVCASLAFPLMDAVARNADSREVAAKLLSEVLRAYAPYIKDAKLKG